MHAYCDMETSDGGWMLIANREYGVPVQQTKSVLHKEDLRVAMDDVRFTLLKPSVKELMMISSGAQYECDSCKPCIVASVNDLQIARCHKWSEVTSLTDPSLGWDQTQGNHSCDTKNLFTGRLGAKNNVCLLYTSPSPRDRG